MHGLSRETQLYVGTTNTIDFSGSFFALECLNFGTTLFNIGFIGVYTAGPSVKWFWTSKTPLPLSLNFELCLNCR